MAGLFDDLIPAQAAPTQGAVPVVAANPFSDLIPAAAPSVPLPQPRPPQQSAWDMLTGTNGPRYQTWPERLVRGLVSGAADAATLPHDVVQEAQQPAPAQISDSDVSRLSIPSAINFAAMANPTPPAMQAGEGAGFVGSKMVKDAPPVPSTQQLAQAGANDISAATTSPLRVAAPAVGDWSRGVQQQLLGDGIHPVDAPATFAKLQELENAPSGAYATAANLVSLRRSLGKTAQNFNPAAGADQLAATRAIKGLDSFIPNIDPASVLAGTPSATAGLLKSGNANYAAAMRSNDLTGVLDRANTGILERAQNRAQAANSGRNLDNTIRSKIASLLEKPKEVSGYNDAELQALNNVVQGGGVRNSARYVGNLLGGGGGIGETGIGALGAGGGAVMGGPVGAVIGAVTPTATGVVAKTIANSLAKRSLNSADELMRSNSPLYQDMLAMAPMVPGGLTQRAAVAKALMMSAINGQQQPTRVVIDVPKQ